MTQTPQRSAGAPQGVSRSRITRRAATQTPQRSAGAPQGVSRSRITRRAATQDAAAQRRRPVGVSEANQSRQPAHSQAKQTLGGFSSFPRSSVGVHTAEKNITRYRLLIYTFLYRVRQQAEIRIMLNCSSCPVNVQYLKTYSC